MSLSKDEILDAIAEMSVMDVVELVDAMEEKFGVSAAAAVAAAPVAGSAAEGGAAAEEKTEFEVVITSAGEKKVNAIKVVRAITGLGLKEAKALVDDAPSTVKEGVAKECAREVLPMGTPTKLYMNGTLRSWIHYCDLRCANGTQKEHRGIALDIKQLIKQNYPQVYEVISRFG